MEYDFRRWTTFPSSIKLISDESGETGRVVTPYLFQSLIVKPGSKLTVECKLKGNNIAYARSLVALAGWNGREWTFREPTIVSPPGTFEWETLRTETIIPSDIKYLRGILAGGGGSPQGITWYDNLKIYQDDVIIYENKFTAPIAKGTVMVALPIVMGLGVIRFGKKG